MIKPVRLMLVFILLSIAIVCCIWISGFMDEDQVSDTLRRTIGIIGILGSVLIAAYYLLKGSNDSGAEPKNQGPGPKF